MRLHEIIPNDPLLEDLSRRGFLKGLGAAAGMAATGASAAPFSHGGYKDQMTGKSQGKYSKVRSDDGRASLEIVWAEGGRSARILVDVPGRTINFSTHGATGRIKIGDAPVQDFHLQKGESGDYSWGGNFNANIAKKILSHSGELKVEIPIYRTGPEIFKFTIEQDNITKSIPKTEPKKVEPKSSQDNTGQEPSQSAGYSASYSGRVAARIKPNITWTGQDEVPQKSEVNVRVSQDGTIVSKKLVKSSGNSAWDNAVLKAIDKTEILPRDVDGRVPSNIVLSFNP